MNKDDHKNSDCFVCAILTHGDRGSTRIDGHNDTIGLGDLVCGTDGALPLKDLINIVTGCEDLAGKPKIFIIQV